ncbi:MAG: EAL domain-containing protein [Halothiobacillaceae bacterium]|nr:EAL domain-containing protein [Halothiobacillaceae bacterium]
MSPSESSPRRPLFDFAKLAQKLRLNYGFFLSIPLLMFVAWGVTNEWTEYQHAKKEITESEHRAGAAYARIIENRLNNQYRLLAFASVLLDKNTENATPSPQIQAFLLHLKHLNTEFYALNLYATDGSTLICSSTQKAEFRQFTPEKDFTPLANPNELLGQDNAPAPGEDKLLSMRYRVQSDEGKTLFYLSAPIKLAALLRYNASDLPWQFTVRDARDHSVLGVWQNQKLIVGGDALNAANLAFEPTGTLVNLANYPINLTVKSKVGAVTALYWHSAKSRLMVYAAMFLILLLGALSLAGILRERERTAHQLKRLAQFNALLAQMNQAIDRSENEAELLHTLCSLAVEYSDLRLAFIARPNATGWFELLASAGTATGYATGLKLSTQADIPEGLGTGGQVWRSQEAFYVNDFAKNAILAPWARRAAEFGIQASATLPIFKQGKIWAIFAVYHADKFIFDAPLRATLEQLAKDITYGLQGLETQQREKAAQATQKALLNNTLAGIMLVKDRVITEVNARFMELLGYTALEDVIGQSTLGLYADQAEFDRVGRMYPALIALGKQTLLDVRLKKRDGSLLYVDFSGSLIENTRYQLTVWTFQDGTERKQLQQELKQSAEFQHALFEKNAAALLTVNPQHLITDMNSALLTLTGYERDELLGQNAARLHSPASALTPNTPFELTGRGVKYEAEPHTEPSTLVRKDGAIRVIERLVSRIKLQNGELGELWSIIDLTELHEAKQAITHQAMHDTLTNLPNRRALEQWIPQAIARSRRKNTVMAVGMLDLDDFKPVNDTHGHAAGDQLLRELAHRLQSRLREADFVARLGGDEFVIVLEDIDDARAAEQLSIALNRLHQAVEQPFEVASGQWARIGMSMGIALYPQDGEEGDGLIRKADATLYQLKAHKTTRPNWWQLAQATPSPAPTVALSNNAYAPVNQDLLRQHAPFFKHIAAEFMAVFYRDLERDPLIHALFSALTPEAKAALIENQAKHLLFVVNAQTTREHILQQARRVGKVHALVGVGSVHLMQSLSLYRKLLTDFLNQSALSARDRYRLLMIAEARLEDDILAQAQEGGATIQSYFSQLTAPMPPQACFWIEAITTQIQPLSRCPGIQAVLLFRPNSEGAMTIECSAGDQAPAIATVLNTPGQEALLDAKAARGQGVSAEAWRTSSIQTSANIQTDNRYTHWRQPIKALHIQSVISIPILNTTGATIAVLTLYGAYPHQFESTWMQQFARNLQQRLNQIWLLCTIPNLVIDQQLAHHYRQVLFADGLRVYVQPIIDLHTGRLVKVEALARLQLPTGELLSPVRFLPLLGELELNRLFCRILDTALHQLNVWDAQGLAVGISVNLAPQTLLDSQCPAWIEAALNKHGIAPERLTLEILESQAIDKKEQDTAISAIVALGVPLAMDDLGAGYSSLQRLATLPFETIKVDQSLLSQLHNNPIQTLSLIAAIIQMGRDFEQTVVVEGLEHIGALEVARILGARYGQGYGIARPMPIDDLRAWHQTTHWVHTPEKLHTAIGALAFHWWFMHNGHGAHPQSASACPLSAFLAQDTSATDDVRQWHSVVHGESEGQGESESRVASRKLIAWLAQRAHEAAPPALE